MFCQFLRPEDEMHGGGGGPPRRGQHALEASATSPLACPSILVLELRAAALGSMVRSALLNFIVFIKLMYANQCDHLIKTFPRALCWLLNDVRAAGLMFRESWGVRGVVSGPDLTAVGLLLRHCLGLGGTSRVVAATPGGTPGRLRKGTCCVPQCLSPSELIGK